MPWFNINRKVKKGILRQSVKPGAIPWHPQLTALGMGRVQWSMAGYANHLISIVGVYVVACAPNRFSGHQKFTKADVYKTMGGRFGMRSRVPRLGGTYSGLGWHPVWVAPQGELVVGRLS